METLYQCSMAFERMFQYYKNYFCFNLKDSFNTYYNNYFCFNLKDSFNTYYNKINNYFCLIWKIVSIPTIKASFVLIMAHNMLNN